MPSRSPSDSKKTKTFDRKARTLNLGSEKELNEEIMADDMFNQKFASIVLPLEKLYAIRKELSNINAKELTFSCSSFKKHYKKLLNYRMMELQQLLSRGTLLFDEFVKSENQQSTFPVRKRSSVQEYVNSKVGSRGRRHTVTGVRRLNCT